MGAAVSYLYAENRDEEADAKSASIVALSDDGYQVEQEAEAIIPAEKDCNEPSSEHGAAYTTRSYATAEQLCGEKLEQRAVREPKATHISRERDAQLCVTRPEQRALYKQAPQTPKERRRKSSEGDDDYNFDYIPASLGRSYEVGSTATSDDLAASSDHAEAIVIHEIALIHRSDDRWTYAKLLSRSATGMSFLLKETPRSVKHITPKWYANVIRRLARQTDDSKTKTHSVMNHDRETSSSLPVVHIESIVKCKRYSGLKRGSIVSLGKITRKRKNGTFDVLYDDGLREVGVKPSSMVFDLPELPEPVANTSQAQRKVKTRANWCKVKTAVRLMGGLDRARARAMEEEKILHSDAMSSLQNQIEAQADKEDGYLKGDAGLIAMLEVQELAISSELGSKALDGDSSVCDLIDIRKRLTDLRNSGPRREQTYDKVP
jgi:hypothetical protein